MSARGDLDRSHDHRDEESEDQQADEFGDRIWWVRDFVEERADRVVDHVRDDQWSDAPGAAEQPDRGGRPEQEDDDARTVVDVVAQSKCESVYGTTPSGDIKNNQLWDTQADGFVTPDPVPGYPTTPGYDLTTGWGPRKRPATSSS